MFQNLFIKVNKFILLIDHLCGTASGTNQQQIHCFRSMTSFRFTIFNMRYNVTFGENISDLQK